MDRYEICMRGNVQEIGNALIEGKLDLNYALAIACRYGSVDVLQFLLKYNSNLPKNYDWAMACAAQGGHVEIVVLMLELGAKEYLWTLDNASTYGHVDIVALILEKYTGEPLNYDPYIINAKNTEVREFLETCKYGKRKIP